MSGWTHLGDETPVARKPYRCYLCGEPIPVGEKHVKRTGVGEDGLDAFRMHEECERESDAWDEMDWECFFEGDMPRPTKPAEAK